MKCPWMKITKAYADYSDSDVAGRPIQVVEEEFKDCLGDECPFYEKLLGEDADWVGLCHRAIQEINRNG